MSIKDEAAVQLGGNAPVTSVIIPTYNRSDELRRTLESLSSQITTEPFEVIICDDGSNDNSFEVTKDFTDKLTVRYVWHEDKGFRLSAARNLGAALSRARNLIFLDCGTLANPHLVESYCLRLHEGGIALCGPTFGWDFTGEEALRFRALLRGNDWGNNFRGMQHVPGFTDKREQFWGEEAANGNPVPLPWRLFWGRNIAVPRDAFEAVNGFCEDFTTYGVEDIEFGYRLEKSGVTLEWCQEAWGVEMPSVEEDKDLQSRANWQNLWEWIERAPSTEVEFYVCNRPCSESEESGWNRMLRWASTTSNSVEDNELLTHFNQSGQRVLFVGLMGSAPLGAKLVALGPNAPASKSWITADEVDANKGALLDSIGLRTGFAPGSFDIVYLSDALAPIASTWKDYLLGEASIVGNEVQMGKQFVTACDQTDANAAPGMKWPWRIARGYLAHQT